MNDIFHRIFEKAFTGFIVFNETTHECVQINTTAKEILGIMEINENTQAKLKLDQLYPAKVRPNIIALNAQLARSDGFFPEVAIRRSDDQILYAEVGIRTIEDKDRSRYIFLMIRDITYELKLKREVANKQDAITAAYNEIVTQNNELKALDKVKDGFLALTSHELRTPLSAVVATAEVLELKLYDTEEQAREFIHTIHDQGKYLLAIVNDILDFSKIQAGKLEIYVSESDPLELVNGVIELFENFAKEKNVSLVVNDLTEKEKCYFDPMRLKQVINNLVSNAVKFTIPDSAVEIKLTSDDEYVSISIIDQGPGIPKESHAKIFNEFETLQKIDTHHKGTGLGLPISKRLMELQGGAIQIVSEVGHGATFIITVPRNRILADENYRTREDDMLDGLVA